MTVLPTIANGSGADGEDFIINHENEEDPDDSEEVKNFLTIPHLGD